MPFGLGFFATAGKAGSYELITSQILTGSQSSVIFSNLGDYSSTYKHLQIRAVLRSNHTGGPNDYIKTWFNGVKTAGNYKAHFLGGNGSTVYSNHFGESDVLGLQPGIQSNSNTTGSFGALVIDILDPYSTTKNKTIRALMGHTGSANHVGLASGVYLNTAAVTSFEIAPWFGSAWVQYSRFSLYGIKG